MPSARFGDQVKQFVTSWASLDERLATEQLRAHYAQVPAMVLAPSLGGLYTVWVLWDAVDNRVLAAGMGLVWLLSALRLWGWLRFRAQSQRAQQASRWRWAAGAGALASGCIWGSAAPLMYPAQLPAYDVYLVALLVLLPVVPVAALASWMPAFYAYYFPCIIPFIVTLALQPTRAEQLTAVLMTLMLGAMVAFARRYAQYLAEAIRLRLLLDGQARALQDSVREKTELIAAAGHDLRQPAQAIGLLLEALKQRELPEPERGLLAQVDASARSLRVMLGNMLDLARLEQNLIAPQRRRVAVDEIVHRLAEEHAMLALASGLVLRCRAEQAWADTDPVLLERILRNLLANALRFTQTGGVVLACRPRGGEIRLQVVDTGSGITAADLPHVFEPFRRGGSHTADDGGLGLGLAIVDRAARLLGHTLRVESRVDRGSRFTLFIDRQPGPEAAAPETPDRQLPMPPGCVLVIDDDDAVRSGMAALLSEWGHQVLAFVDAQAALTCLAVSDQRPGLLLVDLRLGGGQTGLEAIGRLRSWLGRPVPVVVITGDTAPKRWRQVTEAGYRLLHKPVEPERLRHMMAQAWWDGEEGTG